MDTGSSFSVFVPTRSSEIDGLSNEQAPYLRSSFRSHTNSAQEDIHHVLPSPVASEPTSWLHCLLPYLKLKHEAAEPFWTCCESRNPSHSDVFLVGMAFWLVAVFTFCYLFLTISATTFLMKEVPGSDPKKYTPETKDPNVGRHLYFYLLTKRTFEVILLNHLCGNLMEPLHDMKAHHEADLEDMRPLGLIYWMRRLGNYVTCREHKDRWPSSFIADHFLLMFVGTSGLVYQVLMCQAKMNVHDIQKATHFVFARQDPIHESILIIDSATFAYTMILVMGFLFITLEDTVVPKAGRQREFQGTMAMFILLWATNFLTVLFDRQVYTNAWIGSSALLRMFAAAQQVFVTHSLVMLGAVMLGHSAHFRKCPDITWRVLFCKLFPLLVSLLGVLAWSGGVRSWHTHPYCHSFEYHWFVRPWPYFFTGMTAFCGLVLFVLSMPHLWSREEADDSDELQSNQDLTRLFDYDSMLVLLTSSLAVIWNASQIFEMEVSRKVLETLGSILWIFGPIGMAAFALHAWNKPPTLRSASSRGLWLGLFFAGTMFFIFQQKEDCEITSDIPQCCSYPGFAGYNKLDHRDMVCNKDLRCTQAPSQGDDEDGPYCYVAEEEESESNNTVRALFEHAEAQSSLFKSMWQYAFSKPLSAEPEGDIVYNKSFCETLSDRWATYASFDEEGFSYAMQDAEAAEDEKSSAFRLFETVGQAASVEMYFTIFGVLLKTVFLTQHPNSQRILTLNVHHHQVHSGHNVVVAISSSSRST
jgi:hypothetical protein